MSDRTDQLRRDLLWCWQTGQLLSGKIDEIRHEAVAIAEQRDRFEEALDEIIRCDRDDRTPFDLRTIAHVALGSAPTSALKDAEPPDTDSQQRSRAAGLRAAADMLAHHMMSGDLIEIRVRNAYHDMLAQALKMECRKQAGEVGDE